MSRRWYGWAIDLWDSRMLTEAGVERESSLLGVKTRIPPGLPCARRLAVDQPRLIGMACRKLTGWLPARRACLDSA
jgi:hypothetical protein